MSEWLRTDTAPEGQILETMVCDQDGPRMHQSLRREGALWWLPDGSMYVYYTPTHWRRPFGAVMGQFPRGEA